MLVNLGQYWRKCLVEEMEIGARGGGCVFEWMFVRMFFLVN